MRDKGLWISSSADYLEKKALKERIKELETYIKKKGHRIPKTKIKILPFYYNMDHDVS